MPTPRAHARTWLILAAAAAVVLIAATTAAAVITLGRGDDNTPAGRATARQSAASNSGRGVPWAWMHGGQVLNEADYLSRMVAHHQEAVTAARQLRRSDRPQLRAFGTDIVRTQTAQIHQMVAWLHRWYPDQPTDTGYQPMMRDLSGLSGGALDRAFLRDMTIHHMAAVMMSQQLLVRGLATHSEVAHLARNIRDQQHAEIYRMQRWLHGWYGETWHGGYGWMTGRGYRWMMGRRSMMGGYRWMHDHRWDTPYRHQDRSHGWWNGDRGGMGPQMMR
ncbi:DUF305 domain-containing protein [Nocardioides ungokensis]|uniref:DUF305 domain-containing protein n=1 Tax=Nocardioides ungokensis TaxID=1643322 RepID=UPI0015DF1B66|nr:DUF305 domain-containing protein [Nocardioides ungokensis]